VCHSVAARVPSLSVLQRAVPAPSRDDLQREFDAEKARARLLSGAGDKDGARQCLERAKALAARIQTLAGATAPGSAAVAAPVAAAPRPAAAVAAKGSAARQAAPPAPAMGMDLGFDPALLEAPLPDFDDVDVDDDDMDPEDDAALLALSGGVPTQPTGTPAAPHIRPELYRCCCTGCVCTCTAAAAATG
jgi:hypothetical protein